MENTKHHSLVLLLSLLLFSQNCLSRGWIFSSKENSNPSPSDDSEIPNDAVAEFSMEIPNSQKGSRLLENAKRKMMSSNSCWQKAYGDLFLGCSKALADEEGRSRFAWRLSDCFQKDSGRPPFPHCDKESSMLECLKKLDENSRNIYLEFYLETNSICHQLQIEAFKRQTERLVNELKNSALYAEEKLESIERKAEDLLQSSREIYDTSASIYMQTQHIVEVTKNVEDRVGSVLNHSEAVYKQSKKIATSQAELQEGQAQMKSKSEESMEGLHESYIKVLGEINRLKEEAKGIEKKINEVGDVMSSKMYDLQAKADDIGNTTGVSLGKQKQLLDGQSAALEGLRSLTAFQSQALEESRITLQHIIQLGNKQQDELLQHQEELQMAHDRLAENSRTMLEAQEAFEAKQASMFVALDKLFALHNAMLLESRLIKSFIVYSISIFILYMFTSTKQTYSVRPRLYIELCIAFLIEFAAQRHATYDQQAWIISLIRPLFVIVASAQLLQAIFTYRDYEVLNYRMLLELCANVKEQFNSMREHKELEWESDSEVNWSSWVETELPDDVDNDKDPDYILAEQVAENSLTTGTSKTKKYNLRSRRFQ